MTFSRDVLRIDAERETATISAALQRQVKGVLKRKGIVVGLSGGIDSSVVVALAARALGADRVLAVLMPERHSQSASLELGMLVADHYGVPYVVEDIAPALDGAGCYRHQAEAIRTVFPEYGDGTRLGTDMV